MPSPAPPPFQVSKIEDVDRAVVRVWQAVSALGEVPISRGRLVGPLTFVAATPLVVRHALGRRPAGWFVVDQNAASVFWAGDRDDGTITLTATVNTVATLWVF